MKNGRISLIRIGTRFAGLIVMVVALVLADTSPVFLRTHNLIFFLFFAGMAALYIHSIWREQINPLNSPARRGLWILTLILQFLPVIVLIVSGIIFDDGGLGLLVFFGIFGLPLVLAGVVLMLTLDIDTVLKIYHLKA